MDCENLFGLRTLFTSPGGPGTGTLCRISKHRTTPPTILILNTARCLDMVVQYKQRTLLETFMLSHFRYLCAANTAYTCGPKIIPINDFKHFLLDLHYQMKTINGLAHKDILSPLRPCLYPFLFQPEKETALLGNFLFLSTFI